MLTTSLTRADASMSTFTTPRIYTCLTDATSQWRLPLLFPPTLSGDGYWFRATIMRIFALRCPMLAQSGQHSSLLWGDAANQ
jgi:hypothetical protein